MAHGHDAGHVETELSREVDSRGHVGRQLRPARGREAPVLDVPRGQSRTREILAEPIHESTVVAVAPKTSVDHNCNPGTRWTRWEEELAMLIRMNAIAVRTTRDAPRQGQGANHSPSGGFTPSDEKSPSSRICSAAAAMALTATHVKAPPTLTRRAPASAISDSFSSGSASTL